MRKKKTLIFLNMGRLGCMCWRGIMRAMLMRGPLRARNLPNNMD